MSAKLFESRQLGKKALVPVPDRAALSQQRITCTYCNLITSFAHGWLQQKTGRFWYRQCFACIQPAAAKDPAIPRPVRLRFCPRSNRDQPQVKTLFCRLKQEKIAQAAKISGESVPGTISFCRNKLDLLSGFKWLSKRF